MDTQPMITDAELAEQIKNLPGDRETDHLDADRLLCELLLELGYPLTVAAFEKLKKWYA
jgi:hypothetical protein